MRQQFFFHSLFLFGLSFVLTSRFAATSLLYCGSIRKELCFHWFVESQFRVRWFLRRLEDPLATMTACYRQWLWLAVGHCDNSQVNDVVLQEVRRHQRLWNFNTNIANCDAPRCHPNTSNCGESKTNSTLNTQYSVSTGLVIKVSLRNSHLPLCKKWSLEPNIFSFCTQSFKCQGFFL